MNLIKTKVGLISLGCDKNRVDSEIMLHNLVKAGCEITYDPSEAEVIIVNTCAFIEPARKEAVETVLEMSRYKGENCKKLVVAGCLPQKYIDEIESEFHEVDIFCSTDACTRIVEILKIGNRNSVTDALPEKVCEEGDRILTTPSHYAYLRIADGCDNRCTYCLIPSIRGTYRSRRQESIVAEAMDLAKQGVKEFIIVAQDVTRYGMDVSGKPQLVELLQNLSALPEVNCLRLLYCYPELIGDELVNEIASNPKIAKYIDIPLQHSESRVLKLMNRRADKQSITNLLAKLKNKGIAVRTTFIVGFPTETEEEAQALNQFAKEQNFQNAGFFAYSKEEGTAAARLKGHLTIAVKKRRLAQIASTQFESVKKGNSALVGKELEVVIDAYVETTAEGMHVWEGRTYFQTPAVDGVTFVESENYLDIGSSYTVKITGFEKYDLLGSLITKTI